MEAISDVYETQWTGAEALTLQVSNIEVLWQDFAHKLGDQVLIPLNTYTAQFPEMKVKLLHHTAFRIETEKTEIVLLFSHFNIFCRKKSKNAIGNS